MEHDSATCEWCQAEAVMKQIMALVEALPEWGVPLFDDAVTAVYEAADDAQSVLRCWAVDRDEAMHENTESVTITMTRGQWYAKRLREWFNDFWIWKNVP